MIRKRVMALVLCVAPVWASAGNFNILDYGAKNDGSAPATEACRAAIPAAKAAGGDPGSANGPNWQRLLELLDVKTPAPEEAYRP